MNSSKQELQKFLEKSTRTMQIIVMALTMGLFFFGVIAFALSRGHEIDWTLSSIMAGISLPPIVLSFILPSFFLQLRVSKISKGEMPHIHPAISIPEECKQEGAMVMEYQTALIIGGALLESAGFINGISLLLTGSWLNLVLMVVTIVLLIARLPFTMNVGQWLKDQRHVMKQSKVLRE